MGVQCAICGQAMIRGQKCANCESQPTGKKASLIPVSTNWDGRDSDSPKFIRRLLFGIVCVFGLFAGLDHLITGARLVFMEKVQPNESVLIGVLLASCLLGGVVAGTANRNAELTGLTVSIIATFAHLWQLQKGGEIILTSWWIGFPVITGIVGVVAGFTGRLIYPPSPRLSINSLAENNGNGQTIIKDPDDGIELVLWRIPLGVLLTLAGTYWAGNAYWHLYRLLGSSLGSFGGTTLVVWQLVGLATILGGAISGIYTKSGLIQGLLTGLFSGIGINLLHWKFAGQRPMGQEFWESITNLNKNDAKLMGIILIFSIGVATMGGWLSSRLFQPTRRVKPKL